MHNYLRAVGFGKGYIKPLIKALINRAIEKYKIENSGDIVGKMVEIYVQLNTEMGIAIHGELLNKEEFEIEYYYPYVKVKNYTLYENITLEKSVGNYSFKGSCENGNTGISIIFYLQNDIDYINNKFPNRLTAEVGFSGLSLGGRIVLPVEENREYYEFYQKKKMNRNKTIESARKGDETAIENITIEEMNDMNKQNMRLKKEDILSIVESSFMPYGMECDRYGVVGKILNYETLINKVTKEEIYNITMNCNDVIMNIGINKSDLIGEPKINRRFIGTVWLQGNVKF